MAADDREAIEAFSKRLLNKLLHEPTARLREGAGNGRGAEFIDAIRYLHDLKDAGPELAEESQQVLKGDTLEDDEGEREGTDNGD
jgi:hypothetical protein